MPKPCSKNFSEPYICKVRMHPYISMLGFWGVPITPRRSMPGFRESALGNPRPPPLSPTDRCLVVNLSLGTSLLWILQEAVHYESCPLSY